MARGIGGGVELRATLPLYVYYGGVLDPFVSGFHEALGLPNFLVVSAQHRADKLRAPQATVSFIGVYTARS